MTEVQRLAKIMVLKDMRKEYELRAKYNGGVDYDCYRALDMAINALEQEPCTDAISMDKTIVQLSHLLSDWDDDWNVAIRKCIETVKTVPLVTPAEKVGQWIEHFDESGKWYECDQCHTDWDSPVNYCPNCGSKM